MSIYRAFVGGRSIEDVLTRVQQLKWIPIFDRAKEGNTCNESVNADYRRILADIERIADNGKPSFVAIKPSTFGMHPRKYTMVTEIAKKANSCGTELLVDAETSASTYVEDRMVDTIYSSGIEVYKTYQMYRTDGITRLMKDLHEKKITKFKIVRGAYMNFERQRGILLPSKRYVDKTYDAVTFSLLSRMMEDQNLKLMVATHNKDSIDKVLAIIAVQPDVATRVHFAQLLGMSDHTTQLLLEKNLNVCKYVPYGEFRDTFPYLFRRLLENYKVLNYIRS